MFCKNLKILRQECGLSQKQVAEHINVSAQSVSKWERGDALPSIDFLPKLAECLNCDINSFFAKNSEIATHFDTLNSYIALQVKNMDSDKETFEELHAFVLNNPEATDIVIAFCEDLAVFAPKIKEKSVEYQPLPVQYYRRFYTLNFHQKTGGLYQIVALTKNRINTGFSR